MGGHALKTVETARLGAVDFSLLSQRVTDSLCRAWPGARPHVVRGVRSKADFGDLDVIVDVAGVPTALRASLTDLFAPREIVKNGSVWSFDAGNFQVDLIVVASEDYAAACDYFAWNDAGNLLGRVAHRMGFKFGFDGLSYRLRNRDRVIAELPVSSDMRAVFAFLGYDRPGFNHDAYCDGFDTIEAMFRFVASSRFFAPHAYALSGRNHTARTRDRKRPTYNAFLRWLDETAPAPGTYSTLSRGMHFLRACAMFPAFAHAYDKACARHRAAELRKRKFNGKLVSDWTGVTGKRLGVLMQECRHEYPGGIEQFDAFVDGADREALRAYATRRAAAMNAMEQCAACAVPIGS